MSRASAFTLQARGIFGKSYMHQLKSLPHIDAHLRRTLDAVLQTYSASVPSAQIVFLNALQLCGKNVPYMMGILVADTIQRSRGFCEAPPLVSPTRYDHTVAVKANHSLMQWVRAVVLDVTQNAALVFHVFRIVLLFTPLIVTAPLVFYWDVGRRGWMESLRQTMEAAGPAFIKWAQWAATRKDMFPPDMCNELATLQCSAPAHG
jgi:aarF domain-containing kinase